MFPILLSETIARQSATLASYPNVNIGVFGILTGNRLLGQGLVAPDAVHVFSVASQAMDRDYTGSTSVHITRKQQRI
jgi:hypothetical protein